MDPLPPISKVFSLMVQEENQWSIKTNLSITDDVAAFVAKANANPNVSNKKGLNVLIVIFLGIHEISVTSSMAICRVMFQEIGNPIDI